MKKLRILFIVVLFLLTSSCENEKETVKPQNPLRNISEVKMQSFDLDTTSLKEIVGQKGTKILFRRDVFDVNESQKITLELKEFYDFEELLLNNINTITEKGELLESSGVIYLDFKSDGKSLSLKENEKIGITFPDDRVGTNGIYSASVDTLNQFTWKEQEVYVTIMEFDEEYGIELEKSIPRDSLRYYLREIDTLIPEMLPGQTRVPNYNITGRVFLDKLKWINIDVVVKPDYLVNFELVPNLKELDYLKVYFVYNDINSFISRFRWTDNLEFKNIPVKNKTDLVVLGVAEDIIYSTKVNLNKINSSTIDVILKESTIDEVRDLLKP